MIAYYDCQSSPFTLFIALNIWASSINFRYFPEFSQFQTSNIQPRLSLEEILQTFDQLRFYSRQTWERSIRFDQPLMAWWEILSVVNPPQVVI